MEPEIPDREIQNVRGARIMGAQNWKEEKKLRAFLGIFHPQLSKAEVDALMEEEDA